MCYFGYAYEQILRYERAFEKNARHVIVILKNMNDINC